MSLGPVIDMKDDILGDRAAFWDSIYEEYYGGPLVPDSSTGGAPTIMISKIILMAILSMFYLVW